MTRSAAIKDALPRPQSLPQRHGLGLYPERISGTSFTAKRAVNKQTFLYRILPSTAQSSWNKLSDHPLNHRSHSAELNFVPDQLIWPPIQVQEDKTFLDGLQMIGGAGDPTVKNGVAYYVYTCGLGMDEKQAFYSADGDMLIVPQMGALDIQTEMGDIRVRPREICVVPKGIRFRVSLPEGPSRGHVIETYSGHFDLPELGPIGSLGLANVRDFEIPRARYVDTEEITEVTAKFGGGIYSAEMKGSAFNAVAWHGTYYPFKYDLGKYSQRPSNNSERLNVCLYQENSCPWAQRSTTTRSVPPSAAPYPAQLTVAGPIHLRSPHLPLRQARSCSRRLPCSRSPLDGHGRHIPDPVFPPQHHVRVFLRDQRGI
jgi:homogentisate 1,2-dioxygenase